MLEVDIRGRLGGFALDVKFDTQSAPVTALFGRSGAGKSSIIAAIAGLWRPESGRIALAGQVLFDGARRVAMPPERRRVGVVFQDARLFPHMSVRDNLLYGWRRRHGDAANGGPSLDTVIEPLGVGGLLDRRPATLSGGEKHRVAIGRALLANPRLLAMDEPLASLDGERKAELLPLIEHMPRTFRVPIVYVSHAVDEVLRLADRIVLVDTGRVIASGPVEEIANRPDFALIAARGDGTESFSVIAATIAGHDAAEMRTRLDFAGGTLTVPRIAGQPGDRVRLRVAANEVILALAPPVGLSVRNVIPARIVGLEDVGGLVEVTLDAGGPLRARVTRSARAEMRLAPGMAIYAMIKSAALDRR